MAGKPGRQTETRQADRKGQRTVGREDWRAEEEGCSFEPQVYADDVTATQRGLAAKVAEMTPDMEEDLDEARGKEIGEKVAADKTSLIVSDKETWEKMADACFDWYQDNCSSDRVWDLTIRKILYDTP